MLDATVGATHDALIRNGKLELATSYMLVYENKQNPYEMRRTAIAEFIDHNASIHVSEANMDKISENAKTIMSTGVKFKDACHVASAIMAGCDCFLTTDKRLLKYHTDNIKMMNPMEFVSELEV